MNEHLHTFLTHIPFVGLAITGQETTLITRLIESAIVGGIVLYGSVNLIGQKIDDLSLRVDRIMVVQDSVSARLRLVENRSAVNKEALFLIRRQKGKR